MSANEQTVQNLCIYTGNDHGSTDTELEWVGLLCTDRTGLGRRPAGNRLREIFLCSKKITRTPAHGMAK